MDCPESPQIRRKTKAPFVPWMHVDVMGLLFDDSAMSAGATRYGNGPGESLTPSEQQHSSQLMH